ncbi:15669_t:CDS:2, partial [Racocetra persica]
LSNSDWQNDPALEKCFFVPYSTGAYMSNIYRNNEFDDEDEITEVPVKPVAEPVKEEIQEPKPLNIKVYPKLVLSDFYREMTIIAMISTYLIVYYIGKQTNSVIARK